MHMRTERIGEMYIFAEALLWSLFPVITVMSLAYVAPLISLGVSLLFSCIFFALVLSIRRKWHELKNVSALQDIAIVTILTGILFYIFSFFGLRYTSPGNASIIALSEIFFSYLLFHVWKKDALPTQHIIGSVLIVSGVCIIFLPSIHGLHIGDVLILLAAMIAPIGNFFQKRARAKVSSETILCIRTFGSTVVIFILAYYLHNSFSLSGIHNGLFLFFINGIFLLGLSKIFWVEGTYRINVMKAISLNGITPLLVLLFSWILLHKSPTIYQLGSFVPMFFGVYFLSKNK